MSTLHSVVVRLYIMRIDNSINIALYTIIINANIFAALQQKGLCSSCIG